MAQIQKRSTGTFYKTVQQYRDDWKLMFSNARTYNQEGSWVYTDAEAMERVFDATFERVMQGSGLPGAPDGPGGGGMMEEDMRPPPPSRARSAGRKQVLSDDEGDDPEYLTPSDEE